MKESFSWHLCQVGGVTGNLIPPRPSFRVKSAGSASRGECLVTQYATPGESLQECQAEQAPGRGGKRGEGSPPASALYLGSSEELLESWRTRYAPSPRLESTSSSVQLLHLRQRPLLRLASASLHLRPALSSYQGRRGVPGVLPEDTGRKERRGASPPPGASGSYQADASLIIL